MAEAIANELLKLGYLQESSSKPRAYTAPSKPNEKEIVQRAEALCSARNYPTALANRTLS